MTDKEKLFCECVANGYTYTDSYIIAYCPKTSNRDSIRNSASRLAARQDVKDYVTELTKLKLERTNQVNLLDTSARYNLITDRVLKCIHDGDESNLIKYLDILNKMQGTYIFITKDVTERPYENLSTEDLEALRDALQGASNTVHDDA